MLRTSLMLMNRKATILFSRQRGAAMDYPNVMELLKDVTIVLYQTSLVHEVLAKRRPQIKDLQTSLHETTPRLKGEAFWEALQSLTNIYWPYVEAF